MTWALALLLADLLLMALLLQGEMLWLSDAAVQPWATQIYRVTFWILLPVRTIAAIFFGEIHHHWSTAHYLCMTALLPFYLLGIAALSHALYRWQVRERLTLWRQARLERRRPGLVESAEPAESPMAPETAPPPEPGESARHHARRLSRRGFLLGGGAAALSLPAIGVGGWAVLLEPQRLHVRHYVFPIAGLSPALAGLRILQISDTHYGPYISLGYLRRMVRQANELRPDLVLLTGDYAHRTSRSVEPGIEVLRDLTARLGVVGVLGNHDHWEGAEICRRTFARIGFPLIDNDRLFLSPGGLSPDPQPGAFCLAGIGDLWEDKVLFDRALRGVPEAMPRLLLSHNPDAAEEVPSGARIDLMLSGHTHGGQVAFPGIGPLVSSSAYGLKYIGGLCRGPRCPVLVSRGVGMAFLPLRFNVPPELVLLELQKQLIAFRAAQPSLYALACQPSAGAISESAPVDRRKG